MITYKQVKKYLVDNNIVHKDMDDFQLTDNSNGNGPFISKWDVEKLGTQPSVETLGTVEDAEAWHTNTYLPSQIRDKAKAETTSNEPDKVGRRADMLVIFSAILTRSIKYNLLLDLLVTKNTITAEEAASLKVTQRTFDEVVASRQQLIDAGQAQI